MVTAESVFQKVAGELENGTIVIGQLELILEYKSQFLGIWDISKYHTEIASLRLLRRERGRELGHTMLRTGMGCFWAL